MKTPVLAATLIVSLIGNAFGLFHYFHQPKAGPNNLASQDLGPALKPYAAMGSFVADNNAIPKLGWTHDQLAAFQLGITAACEARPFPLDADARALRESINAKVQATAPKAQDPMEAYFQMLREKEKVLKTDSNLHYRITQQGFGRFPTSESTIVLTYTARLPNGENVASLSKVRVRTTLADLIPGMAEGLRLLKAGGKALLYLPPSLSFGNGTWPSDVPKGAPIIFFVELHDVSKS